MSESAIYEQITDIRAQLLELIGVVGSSSSRFDRRASIMQDDLILVTNRLGRIASQLDEERALSVAGQRT
jgi:hypothetical protein